MKLIVNDKKIEIFNCMSFKDKLFGFMFYKDQIVFGMRFNNCNKIHTFFMKQSIDICMTDKNNKILFLKDNVSKNKIILGKGYYTYELPLNTVKYLKIGEVLNIK